MLIGKVAYAVAVGLALGLITMTTGCGNHRLYIGVEQYDTVEEKRVTKDKSIWDRIAGGGSGNPKHQLNGGD